MKKRKPTQRLTSGTQAMFEHGALFLALGLQAANEGALLLGNHRKEGWAFVNRNGMPYACYDPQPMEIAG